MNMPSQFDQTARRLWAILGLAAKKFSRIDEAQWAGAFAHYAFFSLFPLIILIVTIASAFIDRDRAGMEIIVMALLMWIYLSGCILIFGACLCAAQAEGHSAPAEAIVAPKTRGIEPGIQRL
jgi:uncharacterized BrkB/YihY/UPF0761 family membrane protein